ncbi:phage tail tape measure protein [Trueperella pyogenes]|uniref:phage tail tape measure protein n=1 Tax=Trueperella pyogenes TaxID=1661 RepID=UPI00345D6F77
MADRSIAVSIRADVEQFIGGLKRANGALGSFAKQSDQVSQGSGKIVKSMREQREAWDTTGRVMAAFGGAATAALGASMKAASDWESAFAGVRKTVDSSAEGYERLSAGLREMARELPASHAQIASVAEAAGQLGISEENILSFTRTMIDMGEATNMTADQAATTLARFANIMGTSQTEFSNLGSAIVALGNNFATTEAEISEMALRLAGAGKQIGLSEGDILGIATALSSVGIEAEAGGSAFSKFMIDVSASVSEGGAKLDEFARIAGVSSEAFARMFKENPAEAITAFVTGLNRMQKSGEDVLPVLADLGYKEVRLRDALLRSSSAAGIFSAAMKTGNEEYKKNTALTNEARERYKTLSSELGKMRNALVDAGISLGEVFLPVLKVLVKGVTGFASVLADLPAPVQAVVGALGGLVGVASLAGGGFLLLAPRVLEGVDAFRKLRDATAGTRLGSVLNGIGAAAGRLAPILGKAVLGGGVVGLATGFVHLTQAIAGVSNEIVKADVLAQRMQKWGTGDFFKKLTEGFDSRTVANFKDLAKIFSTTANWGFFDKLSEWTGLDATGVLDVKNAVVELDRALSSMPVDASVKQFNALWKEAGGTREAFDNMAASMPTFMQRLKGVAESAGVATDAESLYTFVTSGAAAESLKAADASGQHAKATREVSNEAGIAAEKLDSLVKGLNAVANVHMSADQAQIQYARTMREVNKLLSEKKYKEASVIEQEEMRREALIKVAAAGWKQVDALKSESASADVVAASHKKMVQDLLATARQFGMNDAEAFKLIQRYGQIPKGIKTIAELEKMLAEKNADAYMAKLANIPRHVVVKVEQRVSTTGDKLIVGGGSKTYRQASAFAGGGHVVGPGTGTSDSILSWLSNGEYVISADKVKKYGVAHFDAYNSGRMPKFATGGHVDFSQIPTYSPRQPVATGQARTGGNVYIDKVVNPVAEPTITTATRELQRVAAGQGGLV